MSDRPVFLIGFMGSGKSTVGRELASALSWDFTDTDDRVEQHEGRSIERIFHDSGEAAFRRAEWEALQTLDGRPRCVVATGGGLFLAARRRRWLRERGATVWLDVPLEACRRRVAGGPARPLWDPDADPLAFRALFERRRAAYALAGLRVSGSGPAEEAVRGVLEGLGLVFP